MTYKELKKKQKLVDEKLANAPPNDLHRIKGQWVETDIFKPWCCKEQECPAD